MNLSRCTQTVKDNGLGYYILTVEFGGRFFLFEYRKQVVDAYFEGDKFSMESSVKYLFAEDVKFMTFLDFQEHEIPARSLPFSWWL